MQQSRSHVFKLSFLNLHLSYKKNVSYSEIMLYSHSLFDLILYIPVSDSSVMLGCVFLGLTSTKLGLMCLAQGQNAMMMGRL